MLLTKAELDLHKFASKDASRYTLQALCVNSEVTVVTDGHILASVNHDGLKDKDFPVIPGLVPKEFPKGQSMLIPIEAAAQAAKAIPKKTTIPVLTRAALGEDRKLYVTDLASSASYGDGQPFPGQFPNWEMIIPKEKPVFQVAADPTLLERIAAYLRHHGASSVRLTFYGEDRAIRLDAKMRDDGQQAMFLLMPLRLENPDAEWPKLPHEAESKPSTGQAA